MGVYQERINQNYFPTNLNQYGHYPMQMYSGYPFPQELMPYGNQNMPDSMGQAFWHNGGANHQTNPAEWILQNPLQPKKNQAGGLNYTSMSNSIPYMHPYPKQNTVNRPPSGMGSIMNSFKTQDGNLDLNKMLDTAGQMMSAVNQVSGLVKGLGGIFKV